jgi:hypothetical protein
LIEQKKQFLVSLNQPANERGWLRRLEDLKNNGYTFLGKSVEVIKKNLVPTILITTALLVGSYILYKTVKK